MSKQQNKFNQFCTLCSRKKRYINGHLNVIFSSGKLNSAILPSLSIQNNNFFHFRAITFFHFRAITFSPGSTNVPLENIPHGAKVACIFHILSSDAIYCFFRLFVQTVTLFVYVTKRKILRWLKHMSLYFIMRKYILLIHCTQL